MSGLLNPKKKVRDYAGSGKEVKIPADHQSVLLREMVHQLNEISIPIVKDIREVGNVAPDNVVRVPLASWKSDAWVREVFLENTCSNDFTGALTKVSLKTCSQGDFGIRSKSSAVEPGPVSPVTVLEVTGFDVANWPSGLGLWSSRLGDYFQPSQITGEGRGFHIKAGDLLYAEFTNLDGGNRSACFGVIVTPTDRISLLPGDLQKVLRAPNQDFFVLPRNGSMRDREIPGDTNSAVIRELAAQLNAVEIPIVRRYKQTLSGAIGRIPIGRWRNDVFVKDLRIFNDDAGSLVTAGTYVSLRRTTDVDMQGGPATYETLFQVGGFDVVNLPAHTGYWWDEFEVGVNCGSVSDFKGLVKAGETLYVEFSNQEPGNTDLLVQATVQMTDRFSMQPGNLQDNVRFQTENYRRNRKDH